jgi:hypothetical protein
VPKEIRQRVEVPAVELIVQRPGEHDADEVRDEEGHQDEMGGEGLWFWARSDQGREMRG